MQKPDEPDGGRSSDEEPSAEAGADKPTLSPEDAKKFKDAAKRDSGSIDDTLPSDLEKPE